MKVVEALATVVFLGGCSLFENPGFTAIHFEDLPGPWTDGNHYNYIDTSIVFEESHVTEFSFQCPQSGDTCYWFNTIHYFQQGDQLISPSPSDPDYLVTKLNADEFVRKTIDSGKVETFRRYHGKILGDTIGGTWKLLYSGF